MSYCRFGEGDVYMYPSVQGGIECCSCSLSQDYKNSRFSTASEALAHLKAHQASGDDVPAYALDRLREEIAAGGGTA